MTSKSLWMDVDVMPAAGSLPGNVDCDVAVIGSGIAGISTAYELCKLKRFPPDLNRRDSQRVKDERIFVH